ncbi:hypothetical protein NQZ68_039985 [Dissostichus eleginoides]|nr:hypothetical protein NQZ68_039985 [Dissostichus eleginoides]
MFTHLKNQHRTKQDTGLQTRENMKTVILALVVLVVVSQSEALECYCAGARTCPDRTETCKGLDQVCVRASVSVADGRYSNYFMGCWLEEGCKELNKPGGYSGSCCTQDLSQIKKKLQPGSTHLRNQKSRRTVDPRFVNRHVKTIDCIYKGENMKTMILALMVLVVVSQGTRFGLYKHGEHREQEYLSRPARYLNSRTISPDLHGISTPGLFSALCFQS